MNQDNIDALKTFFASLAADMQAAGCSQRDIQIGIDTESIFTGVLLKQLQDRGVVK